MAEKQFNLKGEATTQAKSVLPEKGINSYNRFFINAFNEKEIDDIVADGGARSLENFQSASEKNMTKRDYWDKLFSGSGTFTGRDRVVRKSKYESLASNIYKGYFKGLKEKEKEILTDEITWKRNDNEFKRRVVSKGRTVEFGSKKYRGGQFVPKAYLDSFGGD